MTPKPDDDEQDLKKLKEAKSQPLLFEFCEFLVESKLWLLAPILIAILLMVLFALLGGSGAAPFIYTLF